MQKYIYFFEKYVKNFDINIKDIKIKYEHSFKVYQNAVMFTRNHDYSNRDNLIIQFIALFHDLGRFEQIKRHNTFNDTISFDHAQFGCNLLLNQNQLDEFTEEEKNIILKAVFNHNKTSIEKNLTERQLFHSKIIRDMDKLDIYRVYFKYYDKPGEKILNIKPKLYNTIINNKHINYDDVKENIDYVLIKISWVSDFNFEYTKNKVIEYNYINKLFDKIKDDEMKFKLQDKIFNILNNN